jgi:hypothetical protein
LWDALSDLARQHRAYPTADWALDDTELVLVEGAAAALSPSDMVATSVWLFTHDARFGAGGRGADSEAWEREIEVERKTALTGIYDQGGIDAITRLVGLVQLPWIVGLLAEAIDDAALQDLALQYFDNDDDPVMLQFSWALLRKRVERLGWAFLDELLERLAVNSLGQARALRLSEDLRSASDRSATLGPEVENEYWREFVWIGRGVFPEAQWVTEQLLGHGRPSAAIDLISMYLDQPGDRFTALTVARALEDFLVAANADPESVLADRVSNYELSRLLEYLRSQDDFDEDVLASLEWRLLPALGFDARSPVLDRRLARDTDFFVELMSITFRPANSESDREADPRLARNAYHVLSEWRVIPGTQEDGLIDEPALNDWADDARGALAAADRAAIGDEMIGRVLSRAVADEDGRWPPRVVRNLIERLASPALEQGVAVQIYNSRGGTSRGLMDGGAQEREIAAKYAAFAVDVRDDSPRTAAMLDSIASSYTQDAARYDDEVERRREGLDPY